MSEQDRNLEAIKRWAELYNNDVGRLIDEVYSEDCIVNVPGLVTIRDKAHFHEIEATVLKAAPDRRFEITRTVAAGDTVAVEVNLIWTDQASGAARTLPWCAILTFEEGCIIRDDSYLDHTAWPGLR